ncbi:fibronectin type III domain-containing protein, partial [Arthrobacter sp. MI7-26]|nr:fibronectin type III domain-containing protein [Arthrobacter sp. MI7-26]
MLVALILVLAGFAANPAQAVTRTYPIHTNIVSTTFWVGEVFNANASDGSQICSTYDAQWALSHTGVIKGVAPSSAAGCPGSPWGGCDGVDNRGTTYATFTCSTEVRSATTDYFPTRQTKPLQNPFYLTLPYDDLNDPIGFANRCTNIPWANDPGYAGHCTDQGFSYMKNRWVAITGPNGRTCYGQIEDAGPSSGTLYHDAAYVFGSTDARPANTRYSGDPTQGAGMDVSPALNGCLGYAELDGDTDHVAWHFVDDPDVPAGPWTDVVTASQVIITAPTAPAAPTGVRATAGNASATVSWTAPANGGSPITSYAVIPHAGATTLAPVTVSGNPPATSTTVTGLTNGTAYTFTVTVTNAIGTSPASAASAPVTPTAAATAPAAPAGVSATAGNASATVSWTAPGNGGSAITSYTVTPSSGGTALAPVTVSGNPPATTATVTGLTNGTAYTFTVTATNAIGTSPASAASAPVTPVAAATAPAAPTGVRATAGDASATVSWTAPNNGGSPIISYAVTPHAGTTTLTPVTVTGNPPATTASVTGLTNGTAYT